MKDSRKHPIHLHANGVSRGMFISSAVPNRPSGPISFKDTLDVVLEGYMGSLKNAAMVPILPNIAPREGATRTTCAGVVSGVRVTRLHLRPYHLRAPLRKRSAGPLIGG